MLCFDPENIAELRTAIGRVNGESNKEKAKEAMQVLDEKVWYAKEKRVNRP